MKIMMPPIAAATTSTAYTPRSSWFSSLPPYRGSIGSVIVGDPRSASVIGRRGWAGNRRERRLPAVVGVSVLAERLLGLLGLGQHHVEKFLGGHALGGALFDPGLPDRAGAQFGELLQLLGAVDDRRQPALVPSGAVFLVGGRRRVLQRLVGDRLGLGEQVLVLVGQRLIRLDADDGRAVVGARRQVGGVPVGDLVDLVGGEGVGVRERRRAEDAALDAVVHFGGRD